MTNLWGSSSPQNPTGPRDDSDIADTGPTDVTFGNARQEGQVSGGSSATRPQLQRNQSQPPPPHQPPPPPAPQQIGNPNDSLSLMQLRRIVTEFPRIEPIAYAFTYADTASYEEEIEEWFTYNDAEFQRLRTAKETFERRWKKFHATTWVEADKDTKKTFIRKEITGLQATDLRRRCKSLQTLLHISLGVWDETANTQNTMIDSDMADEAEVVKSRTAATKSQIESMKTGILLIGECGGICQIYELMKRAFERIWGEEDREIQTLESDVPFVQSELYNVTTVLYVLVETARSRPEDLDVIHTELSSLNPELVKYLVTLATKLRWDDTNELPQTRIFLLLWKAILLRFGGIADVDEVKKATSETAPEAVGAGDLITASPLDYHVFRQEITSKYPAYIPPAPLLPIELENNSILPPLPNHPARNTGANGILPTPLNANSAGGSILHQPVHIATPAPSPPPSPPVGGKAGKKQNYQTNQNFPFMYPPLDSTSNSAGGKGAAGLQEILVGRKWEGSDIPASILEAGELFAKRTRMTRAMRQLWDERERFLKFERGWDGKVAEEDIEELDLENIIKDKLDINGSKPTKPQVDYGPRPVSKKVKWQLDRIEDFYSFSLPHLQSLVIVLLKAVLANVTALIMQPMHVQPQAGLAPSFQSEVNLRANGVQAQRRPQEPLNAPIPVPVEVSDLSVEDLEALRSREISAKAVSGILLNLLKWFKVSHILKFEYLTQLLLDSNYLPLVLKLFAHQEVDNVVDSNSNRDELSFFTFCNMNSKKANGSDLITSSEDGDDAAPPPIKLRRGLSERATEKLPATTFQEGQRAPKKEPPEIDELGYPVNEVPSEPKTDFSWRNFFSSINYLRIMQKICKNKAHRNLLLVQYKSSNILKKALKIPQHELRLYTLKLFKNQVPYCGRKWRQGNMRVITAVYLHCRPELRDDWLAGSDVDAEVEEALPLEQALRALTHWHNIKRYPDQMGADVKLLEEEHDFFVRELEKMDFGGLDEGLNGNENGTESEWGGGGVPNGW